jgi:hypothetical protein
VPFQSKPIVFSFVIELFQSSDDGFPGELATLSISRSLNLRKHFQQISIGIAEEQRAMSEGLVGGR